MASSGRRICDLDGAWQALVQDPPTSFVATHGFYALLGYAQLGYALAIHLAIHA